MTDEHKQATPHGSANGKCCPTPEAANGERGSGDAQRLWIEDWLSTARFAPYLAACSGSVDTALDLYLWNVGLCQVLMADISHFEVALRNAYDRALRESWGGEEHWLLDKRSPVCSPIMRTSKSKRLLDVNLANRKAISQAQGRAHNSTDPDQVIPNLTMGFWAHMTDRSRERDLWIPYLHTAWPTGTDRAELHLKIHAINKVRNRVAHNERLFNPARDAFLPTTVDANIFRLLRALCPEAAARLYGGDGAASVELYVRDHPTPANVLI